VALRILHVLDHSIPLHSGYSFRTRAIIDGQRALGWETLHLTGPKQGDGVRREETIDGLDFFRTPATTIGQRLPLAGHLLVARAIERRLLEVARRTEPDVIHAHSPALNGLAASRVARRLGLPLVYEVRAFWEDAAVDHGTTREGSLRYRLTRALETFVLERADAVTCICEGLRAEIVARGVDPQCVQVIPNAVDTARFVRDPPRDDALADSLGIGDRNVVGFLGSFYAYEGLDLAVRAIDVLRQRGRDVRLLLVGGGPQEENLRALVSRLRLDASGIFAGRVPHADVPRYYGLIDALVYPRRSMRLTELVTPLKPLEAMAQGRPVIASDVGGHRELIDSGENGLLFPAGDIEALAESIDALVRDPEQRARLVAAGWRRVDSERTWPRSIERYREVYAAVSPAGAFESHHV